MAIEAEKLIVALEARTPASAERNCGSCSLCCKLAKIAELEKPAGEWCKECKPGKGCAIYQDRPAVCRNFQCAWLQGHMSDTWYPLKSRMVLYEQFPHFIVLVDPGHQDQWQKEPYLTHLKARAIKAAENGGLVCIFIGDRRVNVGHVAAAKTFIMAADDSPESTRLKEYMAERQRMGLPGTIGKSR